MLQVRLSHEPRRQAVNQECDTTINKTSTEAVTYQVFVLAVHGFCLFQTFTCLAKINMFSYTTGHEQEREKEKTYTD